jgi:hypothetical protein
MPIRINGNSVIESFNDVIPKAAPHGEDYLRAIARGVQEYEPPVTMDIDELIGDRAFGQSGWPCLVVIPTNSRLQHYRTAHYGHASGGSLNIGWYLVGGERAAGRQIGVFNIGAATDLDVEEVMSIVQLVHTYAVMPAIEQIVNLGTGNSGGFLGV